MITEATIQQWQGDHDVIMSVRAYKALVKLMAGKDSTDTLEENVRYLLDRCPYRCDS